MTNSGLIFLDKPEGLTSRRADNILMRKFATKRVGHLGTLDPFASGLLIVGVGEGTKLLAVLEESCKSYRAELQLGCATDTGDCEGQVSANCPVPDLDPEYLKAVLKGFVGDSYQLPPKYSAIKVQGRPLYKYARAGETVEVKERKIKILEMEFIEYQSSTHLLSFSVICSKGTYIRTLGEDIARQLGTCGHLVALRRTGIDQLTLDCPAVSDIENPKLVSLIEAADLLGIPKIMVSGPFNGEARKLDCSSKIVLGCSTDNQPIALYEQREAGIYYVKRGFHGAD